MVSAIQGSGLSPHPGTSHFHRGHDSQLVIPAIILKNEANSQNLARLIVINIQFKKKKKV